MLNVYLSGEIHTNWRMKLLPFVIKKSWLFSFRRQQPIMKIQITVG